MKFLGPVIAALALVACAGTRRTVEAPVELAVAPIGSGAQAAVAGGDRGSQRQCTVRLVGGRVEKSTQGCFIDEHLSDGPGLLVYPCTGTGAAEAQFGPHKYSGQIRNGEVEVELGTELDWEDGCRWGTHTVLRGTVLTNGHVSRKKLAWRYEDRVLKGSNCSAICTARASVEVHPHDGEGHKRSPTDDDDDDDEEDHD